MGWPGLIVLLLLAAVRTIWADQALFESDKAFDKGEYGDFVKEDYKSIGLTSAPRPNVFERVPGACDGDDGLMVMVTLRGGAVPQPGPSILDGQGRLVWSNTNYVQPYNLQVQTYHGEQFLTLWAGNDGVKGHGAGFYYMLDSTYAERYRIAAGNGLEADLHEFHLTPNDTALITIYQIIQFDLTSVDKPVNGWIWDGLFQEVDIETGEVLFEWRASDHVAVADSFWGPGTLGVTMNDAWDFFHINSVEKDERGNYLISSRWMHAVYYISGTTGDIIWTLGGREENNNFRDLSDGAATHFASQHHARWHDGYSSITLFDNSNPNGPGHPSSGLWLDLDFEEMTVKLRTQYLSPITVRSDSQGSMQTLPSGNVLVGYGSTPQYVEFSRDGDVLCETHLAPADGFGTASVQSYRIQKFAWVGKPQTEPDIAQINGTLYLSHNGATEIRYWKIEATDSKPEKEVDDNSSSSNVEAEFHEVMRVEKAGFETVIPLVGVQQPYIRATALDASGNSLGQTRTVDRGEILPTVSETATTETKGAKELRRVQRSLLIAAVSLVGATLLFGIGFGAFAAFSYFRKHSHYQRARGEQEMEEEMMFDESMLSGPDEMDLYPEEDDDDDHGDLAIKRASTSGSEMAMLNPRASKQLERDRPSISP
ncbi:ASST-domain-containing protein [Exophiala viscosa]|uniref:ASST-domain-containing protein n=1 Tax=Exophiala viscosa TaxID=2486360 RepID=A0AAN6IIM2_9EURO|nr:ASST-domain-containing protein [Exophiala viscosa]